MDARHRDRDGENRVNCYATARPVAYPSAVAASPPRSDSTSGADERAVLDPGLELSVVRRRCHRVLFSPARSMAMMNLQIHQSVKGERVEDDDSRYTKNLGRNLIIGLITVYPATVGLCFAAIRDLGQSAVIAAVPAIFAGPYVGLLITLISAVAPKRAVDASTVQPRVPAATVATRPGVSDAAA